MIKSKNVKVLTLSVLCCAVLTACGGGGEDSLFIGNGKKANVDDNGGGNDGGGNDVVTTPGGLPINDDYTPTVHKFLSDGTTGIGQQTDLIVSSVRHGTKRYGAVKFNQVGVISEVCLYGSGDCVDKSLQKALERAEDRLAKSKEQLGKEEENLKTILGTDNPDKAQVKELQDKIADLQAQVDDAEQYKEAVKESIPDNGVVVMRNVDDSILQGRNAGTIDFDSLPSIHDPEYADYLVQRDAGIIKVDSMRKKDGSEMPDGGTIDRAFNGVTLFQDPLGRHYINAYARDPAAAGWAYQTFAVFSDRDYQEKRDLNIGYQSFGQKTKNSELPAQGTATYRGISHAYYNKNQVTSHNKIDVDFAEHSVKYRTEGTPLLHTFEGGDHIVQEMADYAVSADAKFAKDSNSFSGTATTAGGLTGTLQGQFYGGNVQEVGGVYGLKDDGDTVHYIGGFGAKRK